MHPHSRVLLTLAACATLAAGTVRADPIDVELLKRGPDLVRHCLERKCKHVGVFKFMVKKGKEAPSFNVGLLNDSIANRLENALILANDPSKPVGIIRDATGAAAAQAPKVGFRTAADREQLFKLDYPLAWGQEKVKADGFFIGLVELSEEDLRNVRVTISWIEQQSPRLRDLLQFQVKADRNLLAESGQSFALSKRGLLTARDLEDLNQAAAESAKQLDAQGKDWNGAATAKPNAEAPADAFDLVKLDLLYDGVAQNLTKDPASAGEYRAADPKPGQTILCKLTNLTGEKLGVVLKVNGQSTIDREEKEPDRCARWVLEPKASYAVRGFYQGNQVSLFKALSDEASASVWSNFQRAGAIDLAVFREGGLQPAVEEAQPSLRSGRHSATQPAPDTLAAAREALRKNLNAKPPKTRGLIVSGEKETVNLLPVELKHPVWSANAHIVYYVRPATGTPPP